MINLDIQGIPHKKDKLNEPRLGDLHHIKFFFYKFKYRVNHITLRFIFINLDIQGEPCYIEVYID